MGDKPEVQFRAGTVSVSIFKNTFERDGQTRDMLSMNLQKSYQKDGEWKRTNSLSVNDIPKAILVLQKAYEYAYIGRKKGGSSDAGAGGGDPAPDGFDDGDTPF